MILYREHLRDGDDTTTNTYGDTIYGIRDEERVDEQIGTHVVHPDAPGAFIVGSSRTKHHANIHVGELHWQANDANTRGDPTDPNITPEPSLRFEVDIDERTGLSQSDAEELLSDVSDNYALYGMNVTFEVDQEIPGQHVNRAATTQPPYDWKHLDNIRSAYHDNRSMAYMILTTNSTGKYNTGRASRRGDTYSAPHDFGTALFMDTFRNIYFQNRVLSTTTHEVGHLLDAGFADESSAGEIYSGSTNDTTPEKVQIQTVLEEEWSVMSSGYQLLYQDPPLNGDYIPFSIEELLTVDFENVDSRN